MGGTGLGVYAKRDVAHAIRGVEWDGMCVGRAGSSEPRGNVCACVRVWDSRVSVVSSRLSSGHGNVAERCREYEELSEGLSCGGAAGEEDYVFWAGDLNFRIELGEDAIRARFAGLDYAGLAAHDQLLREQRAGTAFPGFQEAPLAFRPTCKYAGNSSIISSSSSNCGGGKEHTERPAWRDRILWRVCGDAASSVTCLHYTTHDVAGSDHRPVSGVFLVRVREVDAGWRASRDAELRDLVATSGAGTCADHPCLEVAPVRVALGRVLCGTSQGQEVTLHNGGGRVVRWRAAVKWSGQESWLRAEPRGGTLLPGERLAVRITAAVPACAPRGGTLEGSVSFCVCCTDAGADAASATATVAVTAECVSTCFGLSLSTLVHHHHALRDSSSKDSDNDSDSDFVPGNIPLPLPKEVWRMVDYLYREGLGTPNLFMRGGTSVADSAAARECLDSGARFEERGVTVHGVADALLAFLDALPEPVVPVGLFAQCVEASASRAAAHAFVTERLPPAHYSVFYYLVSFLREAVGRCAENGLTAERAAAVFSEVLLKPPGKPCGRSCQPSACAPRNKKADFLMHFLVPSPGN